MKKYMVSVCCCALFSLQADEPQTLKNIPEKTVSSVEKTVKVVTPSSHSVKIVTGDPMKILNGSEQWKDLSTKAQQDVERKAKELEKKQQEAIALEEELNTMGSTVKPEVKSEKQTKLAVLRGEMEVKSAMLQRDMQEAGNRAQAEIFKEVERASAEVAQQKGYDVILANGVLYASPKLDVTYEIVTNMNEKYAEHKKRQEKPLAKKAEAKAPTAASTR